MTVPTPPTVPVPNPPPTPWIVEASTERVELRGNTAEVTFTVKNQQATTQRAVFEVVPGDAVAASWFAIDGERQRAIAANQSTQYKVTITAPPGTPVASYWFQSRVYAADVAPEESSTLSNRVTFSVTTDTEAPKKPFPWWIIAVIVAVLLVVGAVGFFLTRDDGPATVPAVTDKVSAQAVAELNDAGFENVKVVKVQSTEVAPDVAINTVPAEGSTAETADEVVLRVAVNFEKPTLGAPINNQQFAAASTTSVGLAWNPVPGATTYTLTMVLPRCPFDRPLTTAVVSADLAEKTAPPASMPDGIPFVVSERELILGKDQVFKLCAASLAAPFDPVTQTVEGLNATVPIDTGGKATIAQWSVAALDDEGNPGPRSEVRQFSLVL